MLISPIAFFVLVPNISAGKCSFVYLGVLRNPCCYSDFLLIRSSCFKAVHSFVEEWRNVRNAAML